VVGCKLDRLDENKQMSLEQVMSPLMKQFPEIEACMECSSYKIVEVSFSPYIANQILFLFFFYSYYCSN
jgi:mitochondrial Rho GTPase 1